MSISNIIMLVMHISNNLNRFVTLPTKEINNKVIISYDTVGIFIIIFILLVGLSLKLLNSKLVTK